MGETLVYLLRAGIPSAMVDHSRITIASPDEFDALRAATFPNVTIFLYRIAVSAAMRNAPPRRLPNGNLQRRPLPVELSYLVTAWAQDTRDEHLVIGRILQTLHDHADLGTSELQGSSWESDDSVQLALESLPLEDHYRIWDANEVPYHLSLTYVARVIAIAPSLELVSPPVVEARIG